MILRILNADDPMLQNPTETVGEITDGTKALIESMIDTIRWLNKRHKKDPSKFNGAVGLSANQVGQAKRIAVIESPRHIKGPLIMVNPEITWTSDKKKLNREGCLSLPLYDCWVSRHKEVIVKFLDKNGKEKSLKAKNFLARIVEHELDHLSGVLIVNRAESGPETRFEPAHSAETL